MNPKKLFSLSFILVIAMTGLSTCGKQEEGTPASQETSGPHQFAQEITLQEALPGLGVSQSVKVPVSIRNTSNFTWPAAGDHPVRFGYHWLDKDGKEIVHDGERTLLSEDLPAGTAAKLIATVNAPPAPGDYTLRLTFVQEGVAWFNDAGAKAVDVPVKVESK